MQIIIRNTVGTNKVQFFTSGQMHNTTDKESYTETNIKLYRANI